jgi:WS/DGAT/MGAT family acyltransferase
MTSSDAAFLYVERPSAPLHIGSLGIYEGAIPFDDFVEHINARLPNIPRDRQRTVSVPFSVAHPTWEDDPEFDIRNHIKLVTLPPPGNRRQLIELTGDLFATQLNRARPLWEMFVIHGIDGDRSGVISKVHHCMIDGVSGIELLMQVVDISPEPSPPPEQTPWMPEPLPGPSERFIDGFWDQLARQGEFMRQWQRSLLNPQTRVREAEAVSRAFRSIAPWLARPAPRLPFMRTLTGQRRTAFAEVSFPEIREVRTTLGGTVNDVVLAVIAGALRRYLEANDYGVDGLGVRIAVPVNVRLEDEKEALGNRVSAMFVELPVGEADPIQRMGLIRDRMDLHKRENHAGAMEMLIRATTMTPVPLQALMGATAMNTMVNMICTNVPGPMIPLYAVGHLLLDHYPLVPLSLGMGLGAGVTSYNHKLYFGIMVDPNAVPDWERLSSCLDESFLELRGAAGVSPTDLPAFLGPNSQALAAAAATGIPYQLA